MTIVSVDLRNPTEDGQDVPAVGVLRCTPSVRRHIDSDPDYIVLPKPFTAKLVAGKATLDLAPTSEHWCWFINEDTQSGMKRYVYVPDSASSVDYGDLIDVDPETLSPEAVPEASWWIAIQNIEAGAVDPVVVQNAVDLALANRLSSGGSVHLGSGAPPDLIIGSKIGDIYIDTITGTIYQLGA